MRLVGVVFLVLGAVGVALSAGVATIFGTTSSASLDGLAPIVGLTGGVGLGLSAQGFTSLRAARITRFASPWSPKPAPTAPAWW